MGEVIDIGKKFREDPAARIEVHPVLLSEIEYNDPTGELGLEIVIDYQYEIMNGVQARDALRRAILRARRLV